MKQRSCDGRGARSAPFAWQCAQKDGCAQRTGMHARPKPTSSKYECKQTIYIQDWALSGVAPDAPTRKIKFQVRV